ncbi:MAG: peptidase M20 [Gemmatimonadetes bacterium]|nr:MAG: peptidase M20 [Gemmatimonadota bacterium]
MARARFVVCCALALAACAHGAAPSPSGPFTAPVPELPQRVALSSAPRGDDDWKALGDEAAQLLAQYLRINTTNPPGHERRTADWLAAVLAREGIAAQVFEPAPGKANLYARLGGDGSARPIILLNHMDVVLASPEYWSVDPFGGLIRDGYIWGRGAQDMKGEGIAELMTLVVLKRVGVPLKRDVIFLATADEEVGQGVGAGWFVAHHPELVRDAEFLVNEGGTIRLNEDRGVEYYGVGTTEKSPFWLQLVARGTAGHGSRPTPDNPVHRLIRGVAKVAAFQTPLVVTPPVDRYFRDLATIEPDAQRRAWFQDIRAALRDTAAVRAITTDLTYNALLRNTISITGLKGSDKTNVIPPVATAALDIRLLPGQDPQAFLVDLVRTVGDTGIAIRPDGPNWPATESPIETELFRAIVAAAHARHPGVLVTTPPLAGFTDSHFFRNLGIVCYGVSPFPVSEADSRGVHGNNERLSLDALTFGVHFMYDVIASVAAK